MTDTRNVIIIGSGPTGYAAGVYLSRAQLQPLLFAGEKAGGQLMLTTDVENYPGFPKGILGPDLMTSMQEQAARFGTEIVDKNVTSVDFSSRPFTVRVDETMGEVTKLSSYQVTEKTGVEYLAKAVVIATGAESILLNVPGEKELMGRGVSTCAVCDAAFYRDKVTYVVGGGDAAMEDTLALTKFATSVTLIHRRDQLRASKIMQQRVLEEHKDKVSVLWNSAITEIKGEGKVAGIVVENVQTKEKKELPAEGVFIAIGHRPMTDIFQGQVELDDAGYVVTRIGLSAKSIELAGKFVDEKGLLKYPTMTSVEGVFAAGDVVDFRYRQAATAGGYGTMAALDSEWWLERENNK